jgi:hypothetical protein
MLRMTWLESIPRGSDVPLPAIPPEMPRLSGSVGPLVLSVPAPLGGRNVLPRPLPV